MTLFVVVLCVEMLLYGVLLVVSLGNGLWYEVTDRHKHGLHKFFWRMHTGLHLSSMRSYGDDGRLRRTAGRNNRATPEGAIVFWNRWNRWQRALRNNGIVLSSMVWFDLLVSDTSVAVVLLTLSLLAGLVAVIAIQIAKARRDTTPLAPVEGRVLSRSKRAVSATEAYQLASELAAALPGGGEIGGSVVTMDKPQLTSEVPIPILALLLAEVMGASAAEIAKLLQVSPNKGTLVLPNHFAALNKQREPVQEVIEAHTDGKVGFRWKTTTNPRILEWHPIASSLPRKVLMRDWEDQILALPRGEFGAGITADKQMYTDSHNGETPWHIASMGSGTGKSSRFLVKAAQVIRKDPNAEVYCVDTKQVSFEYLKGIPRVHVYDDPEAHMGDIWSVFYVLEEIMRSRYTAKREGRSSPASWHDIWLFVDEGNDLAQHMRAWWAKIKKSGDQSQPLVWMEAIGPLLRLGRQAGIRGEFMLQDITDKELGGVSLKMAFSRFTMAGYLPAQWNRIVGPPCPPLQEGQGRLCKVRGNEREWIQGFYDDPEWIRDWALAGRRS